MLFNIPYAYVLVAHSRIKNKNLILLEWLGFVDEYKQYELPSNKSYFQLPSLAVMKLRFVS